MIELYSNGSSSYLPVHTWNVVCGVILRDVCSAREPLRCTRTDHGEAGPLLFVFVVDKSFSCFVVVYTLAPTDPTLPCSLRLSPRFSSRGGAARSSVGRSIGRSVGRSIGFVQPFLGVSQANMIKLFVILSPVGPYYKEVYIIRLLLLLLLLLLSLPCLALPCLALPCPALPCPALPCLALPCLALPCFTRDSPFVSLPGLTL